MRTITVRTEALVRRVWRFLRGDPFMPLIEVDPVDLRVIALLARATPEAKAACIRTLVANQMEEEK